MMDQLITQFIDQMITEAQLGDMPDDFKKDYIKKLEEEIIKRLEVATLRAMDDATLAKFEKMISDDPNLPAETISSFYQENIPNFPEVMNQALQDFKTEFIQKAKDISSATPLS